MTRTWRWYLPRFFCRRKDGGPQSNTWGYWLVEWKPAFSVGLLRFAPDDRENFHGHAFNSWGLLLCGWLQEETLGYTYRDLGPGGSALVTRSRIHKVHCLTSAAWLATVRGPWAAKWPEVRPDGSIVTFTEGRKVVS